MNRLVLAVGLALCVAAWAQDTPDAAAVPDASAGQGGAEQTSEENDKGPPCLDSRSCDNGTTCVGGRCVPTKPRSIGCAAAGAGPLLLGGLFALARRRR